MAAIGTNGKESFREAITTFPNGHIIAALTPLFDFRSDLIGNDTFKIRGGFSSIAQKHFEQQLTQCDRIRRTVTYNRTGENLGKLLAGAIVADEQLKETDQGGTITKGPMEIKHKLTQTEKPFGGDEVQGGSQGIFTLPWPIDGSDPNIPMLSSFDFRNKNALLLLNAVDRAIVAWTRLESRFRARYVTQMDSMRIYSLYLEIYEYLEMFAGDQNTVDIAQGVLPTEEPRGSENAPNLRTATSGAGEIASSADNAGGN